MVSTSGPNDPEPPGPDTWVAGPDGDPVPDDPHPPGQLYPLVDPALYTAAPNTWPTGSKPTLRMAANSPAVSADPHVPLDRSPAIRAAATAGSPSLTPPA